MNCKPYPEYKESGIEWLGEVPRHWEVKRLSYLALLKSGESIKSEQIAEGGDYPVYGGNGLRGNYSAYTHEGPFVLIGRQGALCGNINYATGRFWASEHAVVVHPLETIATRWLGELLYSMNLNQYSVSAAQPGLSVSQIGSLKIPVPPRPEQAAIADFLDRETGRIDTLVAKKRRLIALLGEKRTALISRTVTRGLPAEAAREFGLKPHTRFKDSGIEWLGEVPEEWEALPLRRLIKYVKTGTTPSGVEEYHFEEGGFNWYSPSDFSDAVYLGTANRALSAEGTAEVRIFPEMTVMLVGIGATIGKVGLAANESSCNQQINAIICNGKLDPIFATYYLKTMRDFIVKCGKFTTMPIINQDETKNLILTVPPLPEQTAIAAYLDRETATIDQLVAKVEAAIARLLEYRTALITAAVTGKIDVRGKADKQGPTRTDRTDRTHLTDLNWTDRHQPGEAQQKARWKRNL